MCAWGSEDTWVQTSLVAQWIRTHLAMDGHGFHPLVQEDSTSHRATKPMSYNH